VRAFSAQAVLPRLAAISISYLCVCIYLSIYLYFGESIAPCSICKMPQGAKMALMIRGTNNGVRQLIDHRAK